MIEELLAEGRDNARTGRELADILDCDIRVITEQVERERRAGVPICAASGTNPGYFLPETPEELEKYCKNIAARARALNRTRRALMGTLKKLSGSTEHRTRARSAAGRDRQPVKNN